MRGTKGYVAPEWLPNLSVTSKSDVYSYGCFARDSVWKEEL